MSKSTSGTSIGRIDRVDPRGISTRYPRSSVGAALVAVLLAAAGLVFDAITPEIVSVGLFYVSVVLVGFWFPQPKAALALALFATPLVVIGYWVSIPDGLPQWEAWLNRGLAVGTVWLTAIFVWRIRVLEQIVELRIERVLAWSIVLTAILAAAMAAATVWLVVRMEAEQQWMRQALTARNQMAQVLILMQRMETSQRGYLLTGRDVYLGRYEDAEAALPAVIDGVARLVADNPAQQHTIARLRSTITDKLGELRSTIDAQRAGHADVARAIVDSDRGLRMMDEIHQFSSEMVSEQDRLLSIRASSSETVGALLQIGAVTAFVLICGVGALVGVYVRRSFVMEHLLTREVNHRAKNLLSVVKAIAHQTATKSPEDFIERFSERIQALAANHDLLIQNEWHGTEIEELVRDQLSTFADLIGSRIAVHGPKLRLNAASAQAIGLALHELATNAGKYGALSSDAGRIDICWECDGDTFSTSWTEREGPPVSAPKRRGFGTIVIEAMVKRSLDGEVVLDYAPAGVSWRLTCPVANALETRNVMPGKYRKTLPAKFAGVAHRSGST